MQSSMRVLSSVKVLSPVLHSVQIVLPELLYDPKRVVSTEAPARWGTGVLK